MAKHFPNPLDNLQRYAIPMATNWDTQAQPALIPNPAAPVRDSIAWCWAEANYLEDMAGEMLAEGGENASTVHLFFQRLTPITAMLNEVATRLYAEEHARLAQEQFHAKGGSSHGRA